MYLFRLTYINFCCVSAHKAPHQSLLLGASNLNGNSGSASEGKEEVNVMGMNVSGANTSWQVGLLLPWWVTCGPPEPCLYCT